VASRRRVACFVEHQALRARVRWSHWSLDAMLAAGFEPASDPELALRAAQLRSVRHRRRLAGWVERLVRDSDPSSARGVSAALPIVRDHVTEARESLVLLAHVLRHADEVQPRGIAMVQRLLSDAESVVYTESARGALELQVQTALDYLVGEREATPKEAPALSSASETRAGRPRLTQTA
jgi:hypothetical protein